MLLACSCKKLKQFAINKHDVIVSIKIEKIKKNTSSFSSNKKPGASIAIVKVLTLHQSFMKTH